MEPKHILIVANETAAGLHLRKVIATRVSEEPCRFTLLVPATTPEGFTWTEGSAHMAASHRIDEALPPLHAAGVEIDGVVGDRRPLLAIEDFLRHEQVDEIIVSTLPPGASRWLKQDLPHRIARTFELPVTHVTDVRVTARV